MIKSELYPNGGNPPEVTTTTEPPHSSWLPTTGGDGSDTVAVAGFALVFIGAALLLVIARLSARK